MSSRPPGPPDDGRRRPGSQVPRTINFALDRPSSNMRRQLRQEVALGTAGTPPEPEPGSDRQHSRPEGSRHLGAIGSRAINHSAENKPRPARDTGAPCHRDQLDRPMIDGGIAGPVRREVWRKETSVENVYTSRFYALVSLQIPKRHVGWFFDLREPERREMCVRDTNA
jgi:hypothetical protein